VIVEFAAAGDRRRQRRHFDARMLGQRLHQQIDVRRVDLRLVALDVHDDFRVAARAADDFGDAIGAARMFAGHFDAAAKAADGTGDFQAVGGDDYFGQRFGPAGLLPGVLQEGLARLSQKQLARQARRLQPSRNDSVNAHRKPPCPRNGVF
jgi:hypothetical protein